jgi:nucleoside-diphosphate-sugar epimerase
MPRELLTITGGAGRIGSALTPLLREPYRIRLADRRELPAGVEPDEFVFGDVTDLAAAERAVAGASAVLHLAGNPSTAATWDEVRPANIDGTFNVFEAARRHGIGKVVFASTNHVMGFYALEERFPVDTRSAIRPDSLYGVSKAFGEALARYYSDSFGMSTICLRIGWFTPRLPSIPSLNPLWISAGDLAQIVLRCLETSRPFGIYNATSNNPQGQWDLQTAREELGYAPQDDVTQVSQPGAEQSYVDPRAGVLRATTT